MANYTADKYKIEFGTIPILGKKYPFIILTVNISGLKSDDVLKFSKTLSTDISSAITDKVLTTSVSQFRQTSTNQWGFETNTYVDNDIRVRVVVGAEGGRVNNKYRYINTYLEYNNGKWVTLGFSPVDAGAYYSEDNYYTSPLIIIKDATTNKYILSTSYNGGCSLYSKQNPGIINDGGIPVSLMASTPYNFSDTYIRIHSLVDISEITTIKSDPYTDGGNTNTGGGGGTFGGGNTIFGGASDSIDIPPLPTASASNAGFITLFNPSLGQLNNLANYMWSDLFSLDTFKKIFADPMDCILGLSIVPVKPASAGTSAVKIGNVSTDVSMNKTSSQYVAVDCGTIEVKEYWGAYLDYAPYTQCEIYLPYVGTKQISVDDVMNKAVHVVYHVDILSGACNAYVKCGDSVLYTFVGQCSSSIPISGNDWTNVLNGAISVAGKIGLAMATGGATALMSGLGAASSIISSSKPTVERSGAMSSTGGLLGIQKPYLILTRPKQALPENQNKYTGYPSFITMALSDCTGYTEIDSIHLENMSCTDEEAQEIESLLKSGVIF